MTLLTTLGTVGSLPPRARSLFLAAFLGLVSGAALACEPPRLDRVPVDHPIVIYSDGSFENASADDEWSFLRGRPVQDIGGGRVGQVLEEDPNCDVLQRLLFVDCTTGSAIIVHGIEPEQPIWTDEGLLAVSALMLQPPHGPLALTSSTTVADVAGIAAHEGWTVEGDVPGYAAQRGRQNAFDPFRGCEIFYPSSVGADR